MLKYQRSLTGREAIDAAVTAWMCWHRGNMLPRLCARASMSACLPCGNSSAVPAVRMNTEYMRGGQHFHLQNQGSLRMETLLSWNIIMGYHV